MSLCHTCIWTRTHINVHAEKPSWSEAWIQGLIFYWTMHYHFYEQNWNLISSLLISIHGLKLFKPSYFFTSHIVALLHLIQILNSNPTLWYETPIDFSDIEINATFVSRPNVLWLENILIFGVWFVRNITNEPVAILSTIYS